MDRNGEFSAPANLASTPAEELVEHLIVASRSKPSDRITITGHRTLQVLLGLCRRGFLHVACRTCAECPHDEDSSADSLWVLDAENAAELRTLVARFGRDLRMNGTLTIGFDRHFPLVRLNSLKHVLSKCGFTPIRRTQSSNRIFLVCARQEQPLQAMVA